MTSLALADQFLAEIHLFAGQETGPVGRLACGEWGTVLGIDDAQWSARLTFSGDARPGDTFQATVQLMDASGAVHFSIGTGFTVWQAGFKGTGKVLTFAT